MPLPLLCAASSLQVSNSATEASVHRISILPWQNRSFHDLIRRFRRVAFSTYRLCGIGETDPPYDVCLDCGDLGIAPRPTGRADGQVGNDPGWARREQEQAVAETNGIVQIMGYQQRHHGTAVDQHGNLIAQTGRESVIERGQRFVENEEIRLD